MLQVLWQLPVCFLDVLLQTQHSQPSPEVAKGAVLSFAKLLNAATLERRSSLSRLLSRHQKLVLPRHALLVLACLSIRKGMRMDEVTFG